MHRRFVTFVTVLAAVGMLGGPAVQASEPPADPCVVAEAAATSVQCDDVDSCEVIEDACVKPFREDGPQISGPIQFLIDYGYTQDQAEEQIKAQSELIEMRRIARRLFPETFAGAWIDHKDFGRRALAFTQAHNESTAVVVSAFAVRDITMTGEKSSARIEGVAAGYPLEVLLGFQAAIVAAAAPLELEGTHGHAHIIGVAEEENVVTVVADPAMAVELAAAIEDIVPGDAFNIVVGDGVTAVALACNGSDEASDRNNCGPDLRGGLQIARGGSRCTLGFIGTANDIVTARHCGNGTWIHHGVAMGRTTNESPGGTTPLDRSTSDSQRIVVDNIYHRDLNPSGFETDNRWVYQSHERQAYQMRSRLDTDEYLPGMILCKSGITSYETCGVVNLPSADITVVSDDVDDTRYYTDQIGMLNCAQPGDSGGPLYTVEVTELLAQADFQTAAGITIATGFNNSCPQSLAEIDANDVSFYSKIGWVEANVGFTTRTY